MPNLQAHHWSLFLYEVKGRQIKGTLCHCLPLYFTLLQVLESVGCYAFIGNFSCYLLQPPCNTATQKPKQLCQEYCKGATEFLLEENPFQKCIKHCSCARRLQGLLQGHTHWETNGLQSLPYSSIGHFLPSRCILFQSRFFYGN